MFVEDTLKKSQKVELGGTSIEHPVSILLPQRLQSSDALALLEEDLLMEIPQSAFNRL